MKLSRLLPLFLLSAGVLLMTTASGQANPSINILTLNNGQVNIGGDIFIQVDIGNTGPTTSIPVNKVRAQISIPIAIASALPNPQQTGLPPGWSITVNTGDVITVCNGTDVIGVNEVRTILIAVHGDAIGGPSTVTGLIRFSNGSNCAVTGAAVAGDQTADNTSTSTIEVTTIVAPVTLTDFNVTLANCQPLLRWTTATEINSDRFEIERSNVSSSNWTSLGMLPAAGNTTTRTDYSFTDRNLNVSSGKVLYRLKMIDKDGKFKYSDVLYVFSNCNTASVYAYPNPVQNGKLYVSLSGAGANTEAMLSSLTGQVVMKANMHDCSNSLNVSGVASGVYILNVKNQHGIDNKVMVRIQH